MSVVLFKIPALILPNEVVNDEASYNVYILEGSIRPTICSYCKQAVSTINLKVRKGFKFTDFQVLQLVLNVGKYMCH